MNTSRDCIALIKEFEGFPFGGRPYQDSVGVWTIGYGHTKGVGPNSRRLTEREAAKLLERDLDRTYERAVAALPMAGDLNQHQFDALVSFVFNVGPGAISADTGIGRALRARDYVRAGRRTAAVGQGGRACARRPHPPPPGGAEAVPAAGDAEPARRARPARSAGGARSTTACWRSSAPAATTPADPQTATHAARGDGPAAQADLAGRRGRHGRLGSSAPPRSLPSPPCSHSMN